MNSNPGHFVIVGRVAGVFGIKGWVKIRSETAPYDNILNYSPWYLKQDGNWVAYELAGGQRHSKGLIAQLKGCDDRDMAAALVGQEIAVTHEQLPALREGEYYWTDLVGLDVVNLAGKSLGKVVNLMETGANDVLVIRDGQGETLIPYVTGHYIMEVDLADGRIQVDWDWED